MAEVDRLSPIESTWLKKKSVIKDDIPDEDGDGDYSLMTHKRETIHKPANMPKR